MLITRSLALKLAPLLLAGTAATSLALGSSSSWRQTTDSTEGRRWLLQHSV